jgi:hypothetical protein
MNIRAGHFPNPAGTFVGTRRVKHDSGDTFVGVLRRGRGGPILAECGHQHTNRDVSSQSNGRSAADCMRDVIHGARLAAAAEAHAAAFRDRWVSLTRNTGFVTPQSVIDGAKAKAGEAADAYLSAVGIVRGLIENEPEGTASTDSTDSTDAEPQKAGEMPEWMC